MLDSITKKKIDNLRQILVGKITNPQSQVEQITTGLIYKFMYDIDNEAIEMGGVPSFFIDEFEKYSWKHLFNPKLGGVEKVRLYGDAIENLYNNPNAPFIFREIFKNSFLPFKEPSTLNMFLKEINEFHYSNSEQLGDAYEYLLSFMGSQGKAGQFRTPRHIIDFIIKIVNPQKNETILDPACGTAGFLISSYKHILTQNTQTRIGDKLNASERKKIGENLVGYDIDPSMSRISLVNMYLHNFASPNINEYDTLSSEDKWNEYFDVILANPPFFSPKGGIKPHSRFGIKSTRAEVLFVDYIIEHLKPNGRAGIIVPEGIIFQTGTAYKTLRKKLIEDCLVGVISLPAGVFQPYSGVKTSILILDKKLNQKSENIFFAKVENDGFSLSVQRTPIKENDLPFLMEKIKRGESRGNGIENIKKTRILESYDFSLSTGNYKEQELFFSDYPLVKLGEVADFQNGFAFKSTDWSENGKPIIRIQNLTNPSKSINRTELKVDPKYYVSKGDLLISWSATIGVFIWEGESALLNQHIFLVKPKEKMLGSYLYFLGPKIKERIESLVHGNTMTHITKGKFLEIEIPLPPIKVQQHIINELKRYRSIIDGCRQILNNYKTFIDIDPTWEEVELGDICELIKRGITPKYTEENGILVINQRCIRHHSVNLKESRKHDLSIKGITEEKFLQNGDVLVNSTGVGTLGRVAQFFNNEGKQITVDSHVTIVRPKKDMFAKGFFGYMMIMIENQIMNKGKGSSGQIELSRSELANMKVFYPNDKNIQENIVNNLEYEMNLINTNKTIIEIHTQKIKDKIDKIWGE